MEIRIAIQDSGVVAVQIAAYQLHLDNTQRFTQNLLIETAQRIIVDGGPNLANLVRTGFGTLLKHHHIETLESTTDDPMYQLTESGLAHAKETHALHQR